MPQGIKIISDWAFASSSLTSITLPDSVTTIGFRAFSGCSSLTDVTLPDNLTAIGNFAFSRCRSLTSIILPDSVSAIGDYAFSGCDNTTFTVGRDSYARQYCIDYDLPYTYPDANDWLNS